MPTATDTPVGSVLWIPLADIHPGVNARGALGDVDGLAMSIREVGQIMPLLVEPDPAGGFTIYDGHRRYAALCKLRAPRAKAVVQMPLAGVDRTVRQVAMHALARHFDAIAESDAIYDLYWKENLQPEQIARLVGHSPAWVRDRLALHNLTEDERGRVRAGRMSIQEAMSVIRQRRVVRDGQPVRAVLTAEPPKSKFFGKSHPLARAAGQACRRSKHSGGIIAQVACGPCWEQAIRADEKARSLNTGSTATVLQK